MQNLKLLHERTAVVEQAKGIVMERHHLTEGEALDRLRSHARNGNFKLVEIANAVIGSHLLLADC